ncbi:MAG: extracellular solute-binding protein [Candidatus Paceibacterota bacterium]
MSNKTFQIVLLGAFGFFIIAGLVALATAKFGGSSAATVTVWGTFDSDQYSSVITKVLGANSKLKIDYVQKNADTFDQDLIEALASQRGPDLFFLSDDLIIREQDKVYPIPYSSFSIRNFKDAFIPEAELYLKTDSFLAMPISIDPLVMFWNRDLFANAGISVAPQNWSEFLTLPKSLTVRNNAGAISQSAVALGSFKNIASAKEILSAMILQTGNGIISEDTNGLLSCTLTSTNEPSTAVNFFTEFVNPLKPDYSWNNSLPNSKNYFLSGNLAVYFGFASEFAEIRSKNPNLNFDVTYFPQILESQNKITYGKMQAIAISKTTANFNAAFEAMVALSGSDIVKAWSDQTGLPPVRRDLLKSTNPSDPNSEIFYNSAIYARGWLDPNKTSTGNIFQTMVESVTSGRLPVSEAVSNATKDINNLLQ